MLSLMSKRGGQKQGHIWALLRDIFKHTDEVMTKGTGVYDY